MDSINWISNVVRPKIRSFLKRDTPQNLWIKCPESGQLVFSKDVEANLFVIPGSGHHLRMATNARLASMFDDGAYEEIALPEVPLDPLKFRDEKKYVDRLRDAKAKTSLVDAVKIAYGKVEALPLTIGVQDFDFMGGSLGMAAGEGVIKGMETAIAIKNTFRFVRLIRWRAHAGRHVLAPPTMPKRIRPSLLPSSFPVIAMRNLSFIECPTCD